MVQLRKFQLYSNTVKETVDYVQKENEILGFIGSGITNGKDGLVDRSDGALTAQTSAQGFYRLNNKEGDDVTLDVFGKLLANQHPVTNKTLRVLKNDMERSAVQLVFSMPKGVSIAAQHDASLRDLFLEEVRKAVLQEIEPHMYVRRQLPNGEKSDEATHNLMALITRDSETRAVAIPGSDKGETDPQETVDVYLLNATLAIHKDEEQRRFMATQMKQILERLPDIQSKVAASFIDKLHEKGYQTEQTEKGWDLAGMNGLEVGEVDVNMVYDSFSRRTTAQIEPLAKTIQFELQHGKPLSAIFWRTT